MVLSECEPLVAADASCSGLWAYDPSYGHCWCWRNDECCGGESAFGTFNASQSFDYSESRCTMSSSQEGRNLYELDLGEANPTCEGGLLSPDGTVCCRSSCVDEDGVNKCGSDIDGDSNPSCNIYGLCCAEGLQKSCSEYGFPCNM